MENMKICSKCSTVNGANFTYCKNCGAQLYSPQDTGCSDGRVPVYVPQQYKPRYEYYENDGIDTQTMSAFIGKNSHVYLDKFSKMKERGSSVSWHWPLFVLGLLLGPAGTSFWFFYRKMYKIAFVLLAIGAIMVGLADWSIFSSLKTVADSGLFNDFINAIESSDTVAIISMATSFADVITTSRLISLLSDIVDLCSAILLPMFACRIYEKVAVSRISRLKSGNDGQPVPLFELARKGGTSGTAAALSSVFYYLTIFIVAMVITILFILKITGSLTL